MIVCGPTKAGKTVWVEKLLNEDLFTESVVSVLYCYGVYQRFFDQFRSKNIEFYQGLPTREKIESMNDGGFHVVVLDDMMQQIVQNIDVQDLFTQYCHHYNITVIFVTQNLFAQGKCARNINLNVHYIVLFENKRDESQAFCLGRQLFPRKQRFFQDAYEDATAPIYGYLLIDCDPKSPRELKLRTKIFRGETCVVYLPK